MAIIQAGENQISKLVSGSSASEAATEDLGECPECGQPLQRRLIERFEQSLNMCMFVGLEGPQELVRNEPVTCTEDHSD